MTKNLLEKRFVVSVGVEDAIRGAGDRNRPSAFVFFAGDFMRPQSMIQRIGLEKLFRFIDLVDAQSVPVDQLRFLLLVKLALSNDQARNLPVCCLS